MDLRPLKHLRPSDQDHLPVNKHIKLNTSVHQHPRSKSILFNPNNVSGMGAHDIIPPELPKLNTIQQPSVDPALRKRYDEANRKFAIQCQERDRRSQEHAEHIKTQNAVLKTTTQLERTLKRQPILIEYDTTEEFLDSILDRIKILADHQDTHHNDLIRRTAFWNPNTKPRNFRRHTREWLESLQWRQDRLSEALFSNNKVYANKSVNVQPLKRQHLPEVTLPRKRPMFDISYLTTDTTLTK